MSSFVLNRLCGNLIKNEINDSLVLGTYNKSINNIAQQEFFIITHFEDFQTHRQCNQECHRRNTFSDQLLHLCC